MLVARLAFSVVASVLVRRSAFVALFTNTIVL